ncbi:TPA: class I SAM-dependent methyltransferase, partial [Haemophilus influenzae]
ELKDNSIWKMYCNSLCDYFYIFIIKSILQLKVGGELIFICPDYFFSTKNAEGLRKFLINNGSFEKIILFNESKVFHGVSSSVVIFKYIKGKNIDNINIINIDSKSPIKSEDIESLGESYYIPRFSSSDVWVTSPNHIKVALDKFESYCKTIKKVQQKSLFDDLEFSRIGSVCDIGNGMVSGLDKAFQMNDINYSELELLNSICVAKAKHLDAFCFSGYTRYKFILDDINEDKLITYFPNFFYEFNNYKDYLLKRYSYNKYLPYWKWAFLRNFSLFSKNEKKIFVPCKERISKKSNFRFSLVDEFIYPTQDVTALYKKENVKESIEYITAYLNSKAVFLWMKYKGVVKGNVVEFSEKPLANIPFRRIDWQLKSEKKIHDDITNLVRKYLSNKEFSILHEINLNLEKLGIKVEI